MRHVDVGFFWRLLRALPAAEAAIGEDEEAEQDVMTLRGRLNDLTHSGEGELADALRPLYIDYLLEPARSSVRPTWPGSCGVRWVSALTPSSGAGALTALRPTKMNASTTSAIATITITPVTGSNPMRHQRG